MALYNYGDTTSTDTASHAQNYVYFAQITVGDPGGVLKSITIYIGSDAGPVTGSKMAVYANVADSPDYPGAIVANTTSSDEGALTADSWNTFPVTNGATLTANTTYWIAWFTDGSSAYSGPKVASGGGRWGHDGGSATWPNFEDPMTVDTNSAGRSGGGYVTVESGGDKFSNDAESKLLAHIFKNTQYSQPSNLYVALCKSTIEDDDTGSTLPSEVSGGSYQRTLCNTWDTSTTPGTAENDITIEFPKATAAWGTVTDFAICDAQTLGNVICYGKFTTARTIGNGDRFIIDTGDLDATLS